VVLLCVDKSRQPGFKRLLESGGAKVSGFRPPFKNTQEFTHAFLGKDSSPVVKENVFYLCNSTSAACLLPFTRASFETLFA